MVGFQVIQINETFSPGFSLLSAHVYFGRHIREDDNVSQVSMDTGMKHFRVKNIVSLTWCGFRRWQAQPRLYILWCVLFQVITMSRFRIETFFYKNFCNVNTLVIFFGSFSVSVHLEKARIHGRVRENWGGTIPGVCNIRGQDTMPGLPGGTTWGARESSEDRVCRECLSSPTWRHETHLLNIIAIQYTLSKREFLKHNCCLNGTCPNMVIFILLFWIPASASHFLPACAADILR